MAKHKKNGWMAAALLWTVVIFSFSLQPADTSSNLSLGFLKGILDLFAPGAWDALNSLYLEHLDLIHTLVRKGAHFTEYLILGVLSFRAVSKAEARYPAGIALAYGVLIAAMDETIQRFVDGRYGCFRDVCIDSAGAAVGILLMLLAASIKKKKT